MGLVDYMGSVQNSSAHPRGSPAMNEVVPVAVIIVFWLLISWLLWRKER